MKGSNLGELEELVLLVVAALYEEAYGIAVQDKIKRDCDRNIAISTVHKVLQRLREKGYLESHYGGATAQRGGRRKHLFQVTRSGQKVLSVMRDQRNRLWDSIPKIAFE